MGAKSCSGERGCSLISAAQLGTGERGLPCRLPTQFHFGVFISLLKLRAPLQPSASEQRWGRQQGWPSRTRRGDGEDGAPRGRGVHRGRAPGAAGSTLPVSSRRRGGLRRSQGEAEPGHEAVGSTGREGDGSGEHSGLTGERSGPTAGGGRTPAPRPGRPAGGDDICIRPALLFICITTPPTLA